MEQQGTNIMNLLNNQNNHNHQNNQNNNNPNSNAPCPESIALEHFKKLERFKKLGPPEYCGVLDPVEADAWILEMEKIFDVMQCMEEQKVIFATFMLKAEVEHWWRMQKREQVAEAGPWTWEDFLRKFNEKFYPRSLLVHKASEFVNLVQGNMSVGQYVAKFEELSRFAPAVIATEESKARKFEQGLRLSIRSWVNMFELPTYLDVVNKAYIVEKEYGDFSEIRDQMKRSRQGGESRDMQFNQQNKRGGAGKGAQTDNGRQGAPPQCATCGKPHSEVCRFQMEECYNCGKQGHIKRDCLELNQNNHNHKNYQNNANPNPSAPRPESIAFEYLKQLGPPDYHGVPDPVEADVWILEMEKIFDAMQCTEEQKVIFATFMLKGEAEHWWRLQKRERVAVARPWTWEDFLRKFNERFCLRDFWVQKASEFVNLVQGNMSVGQYVAKFEELSRYAPAVIATEESKARKFEQGLRGSIRSWVNMFELPTYLDVVNKAYILGNEYEDFNESRDQKK